MLLCQESSPTVRQLIQCHYQSWADHSVPNDIDGIFTLIAEMRNYIWSSDNPVLVHCRYQPVFILCDTCTICYVELILQQWFRCRPD